MELFKKRNDSGEYISLLEYKNILDELLGKDKYISRKEYISFYNERKEIYKKIKLMESEKVLLPWVKKQKIEYKELKKLIKYYEDTFNNIDRHNDEYVGKKLKQEKEYLDKILYQDDPNIVLDEEQRRVVLSDEDYTLVIAGAGAGKTTTIEAKVKYLIEKQGVDPNKILIVSFTKKATKELEDRCRKLNAKVNISTFHSIANTLIANTQEERHRIVTMGTMFNIIKEYLLISANDESFVKNILLFFGGYLQVPLNEENIAVLFNELNKNEYTTMRSDINEALNKYYKEQEKKHITIKNEKVRSIEECKIANFLYINGIDYEYEPVYRYCFKDMNRPYLPDFLIRQYDKEIYLEHFGISEDGKNKRYSLEELERYKKSVNNKILLHRKHNTKLIYTFSKYKDNRDMLIHLKEELIRNGISLEYKNSKEIYKTLISNVEDKYFNKFIQLVCIFISRFKTNNYDISKFEEWKITLNDERTKLFIDICYKCYLAYMTKLRQLNSIDFEDMINNAVNILDNFINNGIKLDYEYIFIDEYQDISLQRFDLCEKLSKCSDAKIIAVGDDWQSIFRFSGSKVELFTRFEEMMGYANIMKITKTYRNSQELIDIAGNFVMENENQIKKNLVSSKRVKSPITLMTYNDSFEKNNNVRFRVAETLEKILDILVDEYGDNQKILLIGRYGFEGMVLANLKEKLFVNDNGILKSVKYPKLRLTYLTAHSSKGLGYDNVIIINAKDAVLGFPCKIEDDPIMKLVIKDDEKLEYAEERRLFYVALTRTKNKVFIITPQYKPSQFIIELKEKNNNININGEPINAIMKVDNRLKCPICGYPLQRRNNNNFNIKNKIWVCSNDPEVCGFITNDITGGKLSIMKCSECEDGFLIIKTNKNNNTKFLGCTNYDIDNSGCNMIITMDKYVENVMFYDDSVDIDKILYCNHSFKEIVNVIIKIILVYKNIRISPKALFTILTKEDNSFIKAYKLYNCPYYGYLEKEDRNKYYLLLKALEEENIIKIDKDNYSRMVVLKDKLLDDDYKIIFSSIKRF